MYDYNHVDEQFYPGLYTSISCYRTETVLLAVASYLTFDIPSDV